jgi:hypothetical protein
MKSRPACGLECIPGAGNICLYRPAEARNDRTFYSPRNSLYGFKVAHRCDGKPRLDDVHAQSLKLTGHAKLLVEIHAAAGGLFAIAERRIEDVYLIVSHCSVLRYSHHSGHKDR